MNYSKRTLSNEYQIVTNSDFRISSNFLKNNPSYQIISLLGIFLFFVFLTPLSAQSESDSKDYIAAFLKNLPILPKSVWTGQFSSHSKHQLNADAGWYLYTDSFGDDVIFDVIGPGCIKNMWGTDLDDSSYFKFYFDGEKKPRYEISVMDFYNGINPLFPIPYVSFEKRGYYGDKPFAGISFIPIPFSKSLKISIKGSPKFYHVLYEKYPYGTDITTFSGGEDRDYLRMAIKKIGENPWDEKILRINDTSILRFDSNSRIGLFAFNGKGSIRSIEMETDGSDDLLQDVYILIKFDNNKFYHVNAPIGFFFGTPYQATNLKTLPLSVEKQSNGKVKLSCFFPMPFWENVSITLLNKSANVHGLITSKVSYDTNVYPKDETGYFTSFYHKGTTEYGRDWLFYESPGTGWFIGVVQASYQEHYCEGNEHFYIDNNLTPQINGTGTEDYYLACFWPNTNFNTPFAGSIGDIRILNGGNPFADYKIPGRYYRFHLDMPIPFYNSIDARIQHGARSDIESQYGTIAFLYQRSRPSLHITDYLEVTNRASAGFHKYRATGNYKGGSIDAKYEGNYFNSAIRDSGFYHKGGVISFVIALSPDNKGVRIRRRSDQAVGRQKATVFVNGNYAGTWYDPQSNDILRWYDSEFDIHSKFTENQNSVNIKLIINTENDTYNFSDFEYHIFCFDD